MYKMLHENLAVNENGHLTFAGHDTVLLAEQYGTPLYLLDEDMIRENCRVYLRSLREHFPEGSSALYASKALSFKDIYRIMAEEDMSVDVVSSGELYTAMRAGFPAGRVYFHGNNKTDADLNYALDCGVGYIIVDNSDELRTLNELARNKSLRQKVIARVTPGIDPHTFEAVNTGRIDCQFGVPIETGQAADFVHEILSCENVELCGYHCHIGSQIFDETPFMRAADIMLAFASEIRGKAGYVPALLNLGGGFGVRYVKAHPRIDITACIAALADHIKSSCARLDLPVPAILMEPGRSIVAAAGMTLYTAGSVKTIPGYRNYVTVDGGMSDNPRYALYRSEYTVLLAGRVNEPAEAEYTIAGRCCESGALIQENVPLPKPRRGDIIAVPVTGAYNYSMASNYNRLCRPPIVVLSGGKSRVAVRRESFEHLTANDV